MESLFPIKQPKILAAALCAVLVVAKSAAALAATITVSSTIAGVTPEALGYNLGHFVAGSNAADYWRYTGAGAARAFISPSYIEPVDDLGPEGDYVTDAASFASRKEALRANVRGDTNLTGTSYINWPLFKANYAAADTSSNNRFSIDYTFGWLKSQRVRILANISCSPSRFPLAGDTDWPRKWEIWQHYYAEAFYLGKMYDVSWFGIMNEPNNWLGVTPEDWLRRLIIASDAIQSALADVNQVTGKSLAVKIFSPNTANGASKYDDYATGDYWGQLGTQNLHRTLTGITDLGWKNFHIYNYQKYSRLQYDTATATGYIDDYNRLANKISADIAPEALPLALTEFNSRTAGSYDTVTNNADSPEDYSALGASLIALSRAEQLYLFKFGMTASDGPNYPVAKNGTHYVDNVSGLRPYGGPSSTAEVYRLFSDAARDRRNVYSTSGAPVDVWTLATKDPTTGNGYIFVANKTTSAVSLDFSVAALGVANGSAVFLEEVSTSVKGGVRLTTAVSSGRIPSVSMPAQSVWLLTIIPATKSPVLAKASENAVLRDGAGKSLTGAAPSSLTVRADGTIDGRRVTLLKFPLAGATAVPQRVILSLQASTISKSAAVGVHFYGLDNDSWKEATVTFSNLPQLKQGVGAGSEIINNVVEDARLKTRFLGQLWVNSTTGSERQIDVTDFVAAQTDGYASFLIVQDHRWSKSNYINSGKGDLQPDGVKFASRSSSTKPPTLKLYLP